MNNNFNSIYFKVDKEQLQGPQARCHEQGDKNFHEFFVAIDGRACNEYYDIDRTLKQAVNENELQRLEQQRVLVAFLRVRNQHAPEFVLDDEHCRVLSASNSEKLLLHIVIPTYVFENNHQHQKAFSLAFQKFWRSALCEDEDVALLKRIDEEVYNTNQTMRILGSRKLKDPSRPLKRAEWHEPSMLAEDEEFLITSIGPDCIKITSDLQRLSHADILDDAQFLTQEHLAPPREHLQLAHGKLEVRG
ncbi:hypothetical protein EDD11_009149 [Mortierella claussenii]|nr:hypothetical protein EDD11_009149 [Mortierella claussenii]